MDNQSKKLLACAKCYKLHRKCTGESRPCDYCKERKLECVENPDRKKRGRPKGSKNKYKSTPQMNESLNYELQNIMEITRKRNLNNFNNSFSQYSNYEDPRIYLEYQKRQKIAPNEIYAQQQYPMQYTIPNNNTNATIPYINNPSIPQYQDYYGNNNNLPQYIPQRIISPINNNNGFQTQGQEIIYVEQNGQFPSTDFPNTYPPTQSIQQEEMLPKEDPLLDHSSKSIPINTQSRDLIYIPEKTSFSSCNTKSSNGKCCIKCQTEMHSFKFCPQCGTPREKFESKSLLPSISRRKLLSLAILDIVNENNPFMKDRESSLQTIWFVVRHPRLNTSSSSSSSSEGSPSIVPSSPNIMSDFSLFNTIIKQVSPNWTTLLGYKSSESEKIPLSKFIPSKIEFSPKVTSQWESLTDHTSRSSTVNLSCEFVLCHKFGLMFGVELQITCFSNNGLPDTSFIVVKRHWNLMNTSEATEIFNNPNLEYLSDKAIMDEEEEEESINDPNYELLRKAVDYKDVELF